MSIHIAGLTWKVVTGEKMAGKKEIQKEDEDMLVRVSGSLAVGELGKRGLAWITRLNASEIYRISTTVAVDFDTAVNRGLTIGDTEGALIFIKFDNSERFVFSPLAANYPHDFSEQEKELRRLVTQANIGEVKFLTSAGFMEINPVVMTLAFQRRSGNQTHLELEGVSKEGWVRQYAGEKAVCSLAQRIEGQLRM